MKKNPSHNSIKRTLILGICLATILAGACLVIRLIDRKQYSGQEVSGNIEGRFTPDRVVIYKDREYVYNTAIDTILFIGTDAEETRAESGLSTINGGQADFLMLIAIDKQTKTVKRLQIDRDTMADISTLGVFGNVTGTRKAQICLSHGFGSGGKDSCELTKIAVEKLLCNIDIDFYVAMDMSAIPNLNDALGGVPVTLTDDLTAIDPAFEKGATLTLTGTQAEKFVRARMGVTDGTNAERMVRQQAYLDGAVKRMDAGIDADPNYAGTVYDAVNDSVTTNMLRGRMANEAYKARDYARPGLITIAGQYMTGADGFTEFHVDQAALDATIISTFFTKK